MGACFFRNADARDQKGSMEIGRCVTIRKRVDRTICSLDQVRHWRKTGNRKTILYMDPRKGFSERGYVDHESSLGRRGLQFDKPGTGYERCFYARASQRYWRSDCNSFAGMAYLLRRKNHWHGTLPCP